MSLRRFEAPTSRDDSRFGVALDADAREYVREAAGVDQWLPPERCPATRDGKRCTLSAGHELRGLRHSNDGYWGDNE